METEKKWLILVLIIGALFRFLVARDITYLSDEMVHGPHAIGFLHSGLISSIVEAPIWFYLSDMAMKLLGVSLFSMRFLSFFFGFFRLGLLIWDRCIFNKGCMTII